MEIFISWSKEQSHAVAKAMKAWLPEVIQNVRPWISSDILAGARWPGAISDKLGTISFGIICLTPENLTSPWILFEAGALSKIVDNSHVHVCPYLLNLSRDDVDWPLAEFTSKIADRDGTWELVANINTVMGEGGLDEARLRKSFDRCWPELASALEDARKMSAVEPPKRDPEAQLDEVLAGIRRLIRTNESRSIRDTEFGKPLTRSHYSPHQPKPYQSAGVRTSETALPSPLGPENIEIVLLDKQSDE